MNRLVIILGIFLVLAYDADAQKSSFIGKTKDEVKEIVSIQHKNFSFDNTVVKQQFNYLKYVNGPQTITWIFYFSDEDICTSTKKVCDYAEYDFIIEELDNSYQNISDNQWEYEDGINTYELTLKELDWYFTLRESIKK